MELIPEEEIEEQERVYHKPWTYNPDDPFLSGVNSIQAQEAMKEIRERGRAEDNLLNKRSHLEVLARLGWLGRKLDNFRSGPSSGIDRLRGSGQESEIRNATIPIDIRDSYGDRLLPEKGLTDEEFVKQETNRLEDIENRGLDADRKLQILKRLSLIK